mgnify:FL=1
MFLLILSGILCFKLKLISVKGSKEMSSLILQVVNPVVIFVSYQREFDKKLLNGLLLSFVLSVVAYAIAIAVSYLAIRKKDGIEYDIERFSSIYSNCGFMGIPLINALLGLEGVFYLTAFITIFNLLAWTHGVIQMSGVKSFKNIVSAFRSPSVIAIFVGLISFLLRAFISPEITQTIAESIPMNALGYIGDLNTPLAMIVAGCSIAQVNILAAVKKPRIYFVSALRLIIIPSIIVVLFRLLNVSEEPMLTIIVAMSAPTATMATLFCLKYDKNYVYSSEIFAVTTLFSIATMPLIVAFSNLLK